MLRNKKGIKGSVKSMTAVEDFYEYDDDFENFDFGDEIDDIATLGSPSTSLTSTAVSVSPETGSGGNELNSGNCNFDDHEFMSSLENESDYNDSQNYDFHLFQEALEEVSIPKQKRYKNGTRSSLTFSNEKVREIERDNQILLTKIMKSGPSGDGLNNKPNGKNQKPAIKSSAEVNRRKMQQKINYENQLLKRKLDKIAGRRPSSSS